MTMTTPNLQGPESVPLREYVKSFLITVTIYDKNDNVIREETIDYGNRDHRQWLGKVTFWGCNEGYVIETSKAKESK